jgi:hypothetical protein
MIYILCNSLQSKNTHNDFLNFVWTGGARGEDIVCMMGGGGII